eukprot:TRINITY_DN91461_c0_g1_i1.p1 TRINITY_DN91461_c0_g1~~TRINITY_DN91461_c0_g1_i1.p1  ORF type:complete len:356 (-),score=46.88 TRINITY_DN91461_c0_g1_i1:48-1022(-)
MAILRLAARRCLGSALFVPRRNKFLPGQQLRQFAVSLEEARRYEESKNADAQMKGAAPVSSNLVDTVFSWCFGVCLAAWYFEWFNNPLLEPKLERLARWLREQDTAVVVFELDHVMCTRSRGKRGVTSFELEDYLEGVSQEFIEAATSLSRRGFHLAVLVHQGPEEASSVPNRESGGHSSSWWGRSRTPEPSKEVFSGTELARKLIASRCPDALHSFRAIQAVAPADEAPGRPAQALPKSANSTKIGMQRIAEEYHVPAHRMVLFTSHRESQQDSHGVSFKGILVQNKSEGFQFDDAVEAMQVQKESNLWRLATEAYAAVTGSR